MITVSNYTEATKSIRFETLPPALREGDKYMREYGDLYNDDADIKEAIDTYLRQLNQQDLNSYGTATWEEKQERFKQTHERVQQQKAALKQQRKEERKSNCQILDSEGKPDISPKAIARLEACSEKQPQTKEAHFHNGKYDADRLKLHDQIIDSFKQNKPCVTKREPVCILTGGPPGSGKSTWLKKYLPWATPDKVYHIDADEVRAKLPEYKGWNATSTHQETKDIVNRLIDEIGEPCEYDLIYDGTMNKATSYDNLIAKIRKLGYKIFIIYISVPKEVSEKRVLERYRKRGRYVPKVVIDEVYEKGLAAFDKLTKEADGYIRVNGETGEIVEKGGMALPTGATHKDHKCKEGCTDCDECKEKQAKKKDSTAAPKPAPAASEPKPKRKSAEQFIADLERQPDKLKRMTQAQVIKVGLVFMKQYRSSNATGRDKKHDSKQRLSPTPENLLRWMKHPGSFDLIGVDTFARTDETKDYKREINRQIFWNHLYKIKA